MLSPLLYLLIGLSHAPHALRRTTAAPSMFATVSSPLASAASYLESSTGAPTPAGGRAHTAESRAKISAANKGKTPWNAGKKHSEETRRKIAEKTRAAMLARKVKAQAEFAEKLERARLEDPELYAEMVANNSRKARPRRRSRPERATNGSSARARTASAAREESNATRRGRNNYTFSVESRARISASLRQRWRDPEYRAKRSKANVSNATRKRLSEIMKAKWRDGEYRARLTTNGSHTEERRQKIAEAIRRKWQDPEYRNKTVKGIRKVRNSTNYGDRMTPEQTVAWKKKLSNSMKERWKGDQHRAAVAKALRTRRQQLAASQGKQGVSGAVGRGLADAQRNGVPAAHVTPSASQPQVRRTSGGDIERASVRTGVAKPQVPRRPPLPLGGNSVSAVELGALFQSIEAGAGGEDALEHTEVQAASVEAASVEAVPVEAVPVEAAAEQQRQEAAHEHERLLRWGDSIIDFDEVDDTPPSVPRWSQRGVGSTRAGGTRGSGTTDRRRGRATTRSATWEYDGSTDEADLIDMIMNEAGLPEFADLDAVSHPAAVAEP